MQRTSLSIEASERETSIFSSLSSLKNDMKKNWRLSNNMLGENVKGSHREGLIDGVKTEAEDGLP